MARIETVGRVAAVQCGSARPIPDHTRGETEIAAGRALILLDGGSRERSSPVSRRRDGRPDAAFVAQLLACTDPVLRPSRLERTWVAAQLYAEAMRRTG